MPELGGVTTYPITEPTSAMAFGDLILEVAYKLGCAYYGSDGTSAPQVPIDTHDLALCQRIVNKGIRMFINDGPPPNGWSWLKPIAQVDIWPQISAGGTGSTSYLTSTAFTSTAQGSLTTLTLHPPSGFLSTAFSTALFYPTMEIKTIWLGGNPPAGTPGIQQNLQSTSTTGTPFTVVNYLSASTIQILGAPSSTLFVGPDGHTPSTGGSTNWAMISDGDYTLPADFSGQYCGEVSYVANTNRGMILRWTSEAMIRQRRQNYNFETGTPYTCAVRLMPTPSLPTDYAPMRRRWSFMTWRISSEFLHVLFPYVLGFQNLVNLTDTPPSPFSHDEALKACCLAVAEKEVTDQYGVDWQYYKSDALPKSWRIDSMNAPKRLGYFGNPSAGSAINNPIETFRDFWYQRPAVPVTSH